MLLDRRSFLAGAAALIAAPLTPLAVRAADGATLYATARSSRDGRHMAVIMTAAGNVTASIDLPARAHHIAPHPHGHACVAVARRPGRYLVEFGPARKPLWIEPAPRRRFLGHGVFSPDGRLFYTTEEDYEGERGCIGVRDAQDGFRPIGELPAHGIGPHELLLTADGRTLVIANGGLLTHPLRGEESTDLARMRSSLVYVDARSGALLEKRELPEHRRLLSLRHMAMTQHGTVVVGAQHYGSEAERPPLVLLHRRGQPLVMLAAPKRVQRQMRNYVGSIAIDRTGGFAAASCPRGNLVTFWNIPERRFEAQLAVADVCGIAPLAAGAGFLLTGGLGVIGAAVPGDAQLQSTVDAGGWQWDNHVARFA